MSELRIDLLKNGMTRMGCPTNSTDTTEQPTSLGNLRTIPLSENGVVLGNQIKLIYIYKGYGGKVPKTPS